MRAQVGSCVAWLVGWWKKMRGNETMYRENVPSALISTYHTIPQSPFSYFFFNSKCKCNLIKFN